MKPPSVDGLLTAVIAAEFPAWPNRLLVATQAHDNADLLQCTQTIGEAPDRRYWTEYDYFMLEREARAKRRQYVYGLIARAWRGLATRLAHGRGSGAADPGLQQT